MKRSYCHIWCTWMLSLPCESSHETSSVGAFFVSSCHLTLRSSCHTFCIVSLLCGLSCVINSPDPEKLNLFCRSTLMILSVTWWREAIVTFGALECLLSCMSPLMKVVGSLMFPKLIWPGESLATLSAFKLFLSCVVPSCFFNSPDPYEVIPDFKCSHSLSNVGVLL